jgi:hypothetical protein
VESKVTLDETRMDDIPQVSLEKNMLLTILMKRLERLFFKWKFGT